MEKAIIVAYDKNRAIGQNGDMPWGRSLPADLVNFKRLTRNSNVIMGRKRLSQLVRDHFQNRENIVISSKPTGVKKVLTAYEFTKRPGSIPISDFYYWRLASYKDALDIPEI